MIIPKNWSLFAVNIFVGCTGLHQLSRIIQLVMLDFFLWCLLAHSCLPFYHCPLIYCLDCLYGKEKRINNDNNKEVAINLHGFNAEFMIPHLKHCLTDVCCILYIQIILFNGLNYRRCHFYFLPYGFHHRIYTIQLLHHYY